MKTDKELIKKIEALSSAGYTIAEIAATFGLREGTIRVITNDTNQ